jgi:hypothetical protein
MRFDPTGHNEASGGDANDVPRYVPSIDTKEIFRELIAEEIRSGRMTARRRRRIVRYAASMGLSAVQAGELMAACRDELMESDRLEDRYRALRMDDPPPATSSPWIRAIIIILGVLAMDAVFLGWLL